MTSDPRITLAIDGAVAQITIDRADKLNAMDADMMDTLARHCRAVEQSAARALVVTGAGDRAFSAGGDVAAWGALSAEDFARFWVREGHTAFDALARLRQPVIAVLNGHTLGGGLELAACADIRIAEAHVKIGMPECGLGIIPGWSGTQRAVRRFGASVVRRMALAGEVFDAPSAQALGLVDHVVDTGGGPARAGAMVDAMLARSPRATELTKMLINAAEGEEVARVLEALAGAAAAGSADLAEGLAAFAEKRRPDFAADPQE